MAYSGSALVLATPLASFVQCARAQGVDTTSLLAKSGIDADTCADPWSYMTAKQFLEAIAAIDSCTPPPLGLKAGAAADPSVYDIQVYYFTGLPLLGDAISEAFRLMRGLRHLAHPHLHVSPERCLVRLTGIPASSRAGQLYGTYALVIMLGLSRQLTGQALVPTSVQLTENTPAEPQPFVEFFGPSVAFGATEPTMTFPRGWLDQPNGLANAGLANVLRPYIEERIGQVSRQADASYLVRQAIGVYLARGERPSLDNVAKRLGTSRTTLQSRLQAAGASFRDILDEELRTQTLTLMLDPHLTIASIAATLGFQDPSSFHRRFHRWFGCTPARFRHAQLPPVQDASASGQSDTGESSLGE